MRKMIVLSALLAACVAFARDAAFEKAPYMDASLDIDARLDDLVSRMTLAEKIAAISTTKGFSTYEIRDGKVHPTKELEELYAKPCFRLQTSSRCFRDTSTRRWLRRNAGSSCFPSHGTPTATIST